LIELHHDEPTGAGRSYRRRLGAAMVIAGVLAGVFAGALGAGAAVTPPPTIDVIQIDGLIDPPNATLILDAIRAANRDRSQLLVIKINSGGAVDVNPRSLLAAVRNSRVPIVTWVGPSGSKARGLAAAIAVATAVAGVSNGSTIGPALPLTLDNSSGGTLSSVPGTAALRTRTLSADAAAKLGVTQRVCADPPGCATLGDFVVALDGTTVRTANGTVKLDTAKVVGKGQDRRRRPDLDIRFRKLDLIGQAVHTLTNPTIAYGLLVVGLALIVFEFFTISIGLAGGTGAIALVGAFVGFSHLPVTGWALVLILVAMFGYAVDVQAGRAYSWTAISTILLVVGTLFLYGGSPDLNVYWWAIVLVVLSTVAFFVTAMPVAVRARFSTPTIGRESLIGEMGEAVADISPDGVVLVHGAPWRARTNRATPIVIGQAIRVIEVDGLVLEVEPSTGAAQDYRDRTPPA